MTGILWAPPLALRVPAQEARGPGVAGLIHLHVVQLAPFLGFQAEVVEL